MIRIAGDTHTHTIACGHATGTINENIEHARRQGHRFMATTEHCCTMPASPSIWFFNNFLWNMEGIVIDGVALVRGAEVNVVNIHGEIDMPELYLQRLDLIVGSVHYEAFDHGDWSDEEYTQMYERVAENPYVDIIGHPGDPRFHYDYERAVKAFAEHDKIVEINGASPRARKGSDRTCREILKHCKQYGAKIVLSSDAHCPQRVGDVALSIEMVEEIDFPEELIVNADYDRFRAELKRRRGVELPE
jgi:putative hydrolase